MEAFKKTSLLIQIIIVLALLAIIGALIYSFISAQKDKKELEGVVELGTKTDITDDKLYSWVKDIPASKRESVLKDLHSMNLAEIGKTIFNAHGMLDDDEESIYSAFGKIRTQIRLGMFLDYFKRTYKIPLMDFLTFLDAAEKTKIVNIINKYPKY